MGNNAAQANSGAPETMSQTPEVSPFAEITNADLIIQFYESDIDPAIGRELAVRLLAHAGYTGDPTTEPLIGRDGKQVQGSEADTPLTLVDYVNFAAAHHFHALEGILDFLHTSPGQPEYTEGSAAYAGYMDANRRQASRG